MTPTAMTTVRIGVLGAARIAPAALIHPARALDGVQVSAIAARDRSRATKICSRYLSDLQLAKYVLKLSLKVA